MRPVEELAKEIDKFTLENSIRREVRNADGSVTVKQEDVPPDKGIEALKERIMETWTTREIVFFNQFTHGGSYDAGKGWRIDFAGYTAETAEGQRNLMRLFDDLRIRIYYTMGLLTMAFISDRYGADQERIAAYFSSVGDEQYLDITFNELIDRECQVLSPEYRKLTEIHEKAKAEIKRLDDAIRAYEEQTAK